MAVMEVLAEVAVLVLQVQMDLAMVAQVAMEQILIHLGHLLLHQE
jgi:hypothetical protein